MQSNWKILQIWYRVLVIDEDTKIREFKKYPFAGMKCIIVSELINLQNEKAERNMVWDNL